MDWLVSMPCFPENVECDFLGVKWRTGTLIGSLLLVWRGQGAHPHSPLKTTEPQFPFVLLKQDIAYSNILQRTSNMP